LAHATAIVDTHIDVPIHVMMTGDDVTQATSGGVFDYPRARAGGLDVAFMSIFIPASVDEAGTPASTTSSLTSTEAIPTRKSNLCSVKTYFAYGARQSRSRMRAGVTCNAPFTDSGRCVDR